MGLGEGKHGEERQKHPPCCSRPGCGAVTWGRCRCTPQSGPESALDFQPHQQPIDADTPKGKAREWGLLGREVVMCGLASGTDCTKQEAKESDWKGARAAGDDPLRDLRVRQVRSGSGNSRSCT